MILSAIKTNNKITLDEMAEEFQVNIKTIKRDVIKLQEANIIKRIGSKKTGYWKILS